VREVLSWGTFSRYKKKEPKKNILFLFCFRVLWVWFPTFLAYIDIPGAAGVIRLAGECSCKLC
jgi:hypothetical protein